MIGGEEKRRTLICGAIATNTTAHDSPENRGGNRSDRVGLRTRNSGCITSRPQTGMAITARFFVARLVPHRREHRLLRLPVLACILDYPWYQRARAHRYGRMVLGHSAVAAGNFAARLGHGNQVHLCVGTSCRATCSSITSAAPRSRQRCHCPNCLA